MKQFLKNHLEWVITLTAAFVMLVAVFIFEAMTLKDASFMRIMCDATFVPGGLLIGFGALRMIILENRKYRPKRKLRNDYSASVGQDDEDKQKKGSKCIVMTGMVMILLSVLCLIIYYSLQ